MFATGIVKANMTEFKYKMVIPRSAVLWTGKRSIVYVKQPGTDEPIFKIREIGLGPMLGSSYIVADGLTEGEEIVTQGTFSVDAAAQLEGKPSMMNPSGGQVSSMPGMDMPGDKRSNVNPDPTAKTKQPASETMDQSMKPMIESETFTVSGDCDLCKTRIEKAAKSVNGVKSAIWDTKTHKIKVEFDSMKTDLIAIQKAIVKAGHDTEKFKAYDKTYESLPECCHYR
jgi:Cu(I)/Ag(I) efflux system membrane fusion protein